jgi:hypothetical protein
MFNGFLSCGYRLFYAYRNNGRGTILETFIRSVGDRLLARLVPQLDASACTAPERYCYCTSLHNLYCQECRWCPGTGNTCTPPTWWINGC